VLKSSAIVDTCSILTIGQFMTVSSYHSRVMG
jgi:hypothetical protein